MTEPLPWENAVREIEARIPVAPPDPIVFTGSSSIALWRTLQRDFPDHPVFNAGFGGSAMGQVVQRAPRIVLPLHPKQIVLFAGENDLALGGSVDDVMRSFDEFLEMTAPAPIVTLSVKPSPARMELREAMEELNLRMSTAFDYDRRLTFLDVWSPMLNESGQPRTELWMRDGIHVNRAGYALWTELVRPHLT
jgi:lysophospholipase L1-like esterase